ncbi:hypothetical protein [Nonomuraea sp. NPDC049400]|uniref:hypothetical protein n=1 Tax=Nonomuraea sp. NPDC049400 TaxID=3364352 RepID=UPI0037B2AFBA
MPTFGGSPIARVAATVSAIAVSITIEQPAIGTTMRPPVTCGAGGRVVVRR